MKRIVSIISAILFSLVLAVSSYASETTERLFIVSPNGEYSAEYIASYADEKGFGGMVIDLRKSDSADFYNEISAVSGALSLRVIAGESLLSKLPAGTGIILQSGFSEETVASLSEKHGSENLSFFLPFGDENAFSEAKYYYEKGYFKTLFVENLLSCYSEYGYEQYLLEVSAEFSGAEIITVNDLGRVLLPVAKGDFFGEAFELNNQYLVNKINEAGFCVSDFSALMKNRNNSASFLTDYFDSTVLDDYADFSVSQKLDITRPTGSSLTVETAQYTIFGTSDPDKKLYMNGEEVERISESGLFAATVDVPKSGKTFTFTQGGKSVSVTLKRGSGSGGSGTTSSLSSCAPSSAYVVNGGSAEVILSCVGPSGGKVTAEIAGKTVTLQQVAYADTGVPAKFTAKIDLSGEYSEDETTLIGKVTYTLRYNGSTKTAESSSGYYYVGENSVFAVRANAELSGVERADVENGDYITTLRTGCADYVLGITENGWYEISCGGYIKPAHVEIVTGNTDITAFVASSEFEKGSNYEKLTFKSENIPAFEGKTYEKALSLTLYNTEWSNISSVNLDSELMRRIVAVDNGDGSVTLNFYSITPLWGWDFFTDPENGTFSVVLKARPKLSDEPGKPLSGITAAVCAGHGGPDPGALSVAGEDGVNEAEINLANAMMIAESLENLGANIVMLISDGTKLDTYGRTDPARYAYSDVYICCHANSVAENAKANLWCGTYVYYHFDHSEEFAQKLTDYISAATGRDNEGAVQDYYSVTRLTMCPAVMLEVGFVSNPKELESLIDPRDIQKTALAVTKAVLEIVDN